MNRISPQAPGYEWDGDEVSHAFSVLNNRLRNRTPIDNPEHQRSLRTAALEHGLASPEVTRLCRQPVHDQAQPGWAANSHVPQQQAQASWDQHQQDHGIPPTLEPPYNGPSGPLNPYDTYYRSLGRHRFFSSSGQAARPLRHAVIYGTADRGF
ncbi:hypothetical protein JCM8547_000019 [Rhodosporidiobolus lusitaniae]